MVVYDCVDDRVGEDWLFDVEVGGDFVVYCDGVELFW